jgi:single-strand DNA-binding protein
MSSYNRVILMGNLTRKPEVRYTQSGMAICKVGLAVNRRFKDGQTGDWREEATFIDVTIFGKRGEAFAKFHDKGKTAFIEGSLRLDQWEDKQSGEKRSKLYVVGDDWQFVGSGGAGGGGGGGGRGDDAEPEPYPQGARSGGSEGGDFGGGGGYGGAGYGGGGGGGGADLDEDTPF